MPLQQSGRMDTEKPRVWPDLLLAVVVGASYGLFRDGMNMPVPIAAGCGVVVVRLTLLMIPAERRDYKLQPVDAPHDRLCRCRHLVSLWGRLAVQRIVPRGRRWRRPAVPVASESFSFKAWGVSYRLRRIGV